MGRGEESIRQLSRAVELDPLSPRINLSAGMMFYYARRFDDALRQFKKALEMGDPDARWMLISSHIELGSIDRLFADLAAAGEPAESISAAQQAYQREGVPGMYRVLLRHVFYAADGKPNYTSPAVLAWYEVAVGNRESALSLLEKAFNERDLALIDLSVKTNPAFDPLRSSPRYQAILRRMNLYK
jgi:tetratricopeptide (TPR) repeat protein